MTSESHCYCFKKHPIQSTYLYVDDCVVIHPHRKYSILENHSDLIQEFLFQSGTVKLLVSTSHTEDSKKHYFIQIKSILFI